MSTDGTNWEPLAQDAFGADVVLLAIVPAQPGLLAITARNAGSGGGGAFSLLAPPLTTWTSGNGRSWTSSEGPDLPVPQDNSLTLPVAARDGLVVAFSDAEEGSHLSRWSIRSGWVDVEASDQLRGFHARQVAAVGAGFVAIGAAAGPTADAGAVAMSLDGLTWSTEPLPCDMCGPRDYAVAQQLIVGPSGYVITGFHGGTPGQTLWWHGADGLLLHPGSGYEPLGVWPGEGAGAGGQPYGFLLSDGDAMLAVRPGRDSAVWISGDGVAWTQLIVHGQLPAESIQQVVSFPGGVLVRTRSGTWVGHAASQ